MKKMQIFRDESKVYYFNVIGRICTSYNDSQYQVQVTILISSIEYPEKPPKILIMNNENVVLKKNCRYIRENGEIQTPLLMNWKSDILFSEIIEDIEQCFSKDFPILRATPAAINILPCSDIKIDKKKGEGSFAIVYKAYWNNDKIALKVLKDKIYEENLSENSQKEQIRQFLTRINREVTIMCTLSHPNIVKCYGLTNWNRQIALLLEYLPYNLRSLLDDINYKMTPRVQKLILYSVAHGLSHMHSFEHPIIHRDLKADNILLNKEYEVKIGDFGFARELSDERLSLVGTKTTMAPEILRCVRNYDEKVDVYSYGCVIFEVMTRLNMIESYPKDIPAERFLFEIASGTKRPFLPSSIPLEVQELIQLCWKQDPKERPSMYDIERQINSWDITNWPVILSPKNNHT
ncbi:hypothetical protein WA158_001465 [Blastocystis sp. Blastoise]